MNRDIFEHQKKVWYKTIKDNEAVLNMSVEDLNDNFAYFLAEELETRKKENRNSNKLRYKSTHPLSNCLKRMDFFIACLDDNDLSRAFVNEYNIIIQFLDVSLDKGKNEYIINKYGES